MQPEPGTWRIALFLVGVLLFLGGPAVCADEPVNPEASETSGEAERTTNRPRPLRPLEAVELRPSRPEGAAAVKPLSDPGELTGAGLSLTNPTFSGAARLTEMATRHRSFGTIDVQAMEELLTTKHLFQKIAAMPPRAVRSGFDDGMALTYHRTVSLDRLSEISLSSASGNPGNIVPPSLEVGRIGPRSSVRVIRSLTIQLQEQAASIRVQLP